MSILRAHRAHLKAHLASAKASEAALCAEQEFDAVVKDKLDTEFDSIRFQGDRWASANGEWALRFFVHVEGGAVVYKVERVFPKLGATLSSLKSWRHALREASQDPDVQAFFADAADHRKGAL